MTEKEYSGSPRKKDIEGVAGKITDEATPNVVITICNHPPNCLTSCKDGKQCGYVCYAPACESGKGCLVLIDLDEVPQADDPVKVLQSIKKQLGNINEIVEDIKK